MYEMTDEEFENAVDTAIDSIPQAFLEDLENVCVVVADEPDEEDIAIADDPAYPGGTVEGDELLGLYDGINILERADGYDMVEPDVITIFKGPHERTCDSLEDIVEEIRKTVIHEIGHYFGLEDDRLYEMGY